MGAKLKTSSLIDNVWIYASSLQPYCLAFIVPNEVNLRIELNGDRETDFAAMCKTAECVARMEKAVLETAKATDMQKFAIPKKIHIESSPWTPEEGLVTAAFKLKLAWVSGKPPPLYVYPPVVRVCVRLRVRAQNTKSTFSHAFASSTRASNSPPSNPLRHQQQQPVHGRVTNNRYAPPTHSLSALMSTVATNSSDCPRLFYYFFCYLSWSRGTAAAVQGVFGWWWLLSSW